MRCRDRRGRLCGRVDRKRLNKDRGRPIEVVILEAGEGVPPNINDYMERFYTAKIKVPESPYTPRLSIKTTNQ